LLNFLSSFFNKFNFNTKFYFKMNLNNDTGGINVFCLYIITIVFGISLQLIYIQLCRLFNLEINTYNIQNVEYPIIDQHLHRMDCMIHDCMIHD